MSWRAAVITASTSRAAGQGGDESGDALAEFAEGLGAEVVGRDIVPDDLDRIAYGCRTACGRLVFGGGGNDAYSYLYGGRSVFPSAHESGARAFSAIERHIRAYFPTVAEMPSVPISQPIVCAS